MRLTKCVCGCGNATAHPLEWAHVPQRDRGGRVAYMCPDCMGRMGRVNPNAPDEVGERIGGGVGYRLSIPTPRPTPAIQAYCLKNSYTRVEGGYISPRYNNLNAVKKMAPTFGAMIDEGELRLIDGLMPFVAGPWDGFTPAQLAAMNDAAPTLFGCASFMASEHGIMFAARLESAETYMAALKGAKALILALMAWFEVPSAARAAKVRAVVDEMAGYSAPASEGEGLPAPLAGCLPA